MLEFCEFRLLAIFNFLQFVEKNKQETMSRFLSEEDEGQKRVHKHEEEKEVHIQTHIHMDTYTHEHIHIYTQYINRHVNSIHTNRHINTSGDVTHSHTHIHTQSNKRRIQMPHTENFSRVFADDNNLRYFWLSIVASPKNIPNFLHTPPPPLPHPPYMLMCFSSLVAPWVRQLL